MLKWTHYYGVYAGCELFLLYFHHMLNAYSRFLFAVSILFVLGVSVPHTVGAQADSGITLKPAFIEETVIPGAQHRYDISVTNLSGSTQTYYLFTRDIVGAEDNGGPIFAEEGLEPTGYEISSWITLDTGEITVDPGATTNVSFAVAVPNEASPGSHFGGIFISLEPPRSRQTGATVGYEVGSIVSLRIDGDVEESGTIRSFSTGNYIYGNLSNVDFNARIENSGNTLIRPFGPLEVRNMFGKRVATLTMNDTKAGIFPGQTRDFTMVWKGEGTGFGRYKADVSLIYGPQGRQQTMSNSLSFWVLPMNIILPALGVLAVLLLIVYVSIKVYVRRQLSMAGVSSRRNVSRRRGGGPDSSAFLLVFVAMLTVTALFLILLLVLFA